MAELDRLFVDFPIETDHDRAGLYAMLLTPIIRPAVSTAPMMLVTKPQPREGASLLTTLIGLILTGGSYQSIAVSNNVKDLDENLRKALASAIVDSSGRVMWRYDNMPATFDSPTLAEMLTEPAWSTRLLGGNQNATLPQTGVTVYGTVNSVDISHELGLRCYETRINSGNPRPWSERNSSSPRLNATSSATAAGTFRPAWPWCVTISSRATGGRASGGTGRFRGLAIDDGRNPSLHRRRRVHDADASPAGTGDAPRRATSGRSFRPGGTSTRGTR